MIEDYLGLTQDEESKIRMVKMNGTNTKYRWMSDREFISMIESRLGSSPIIDELVYRLEEANGSLEEASAACITIEEVTCPICETHIIIKDDENENV